MQGLGLARIEQLVLLCLMENPSLTMRFDKNYMVSQIAKDLFSTIKALFLSDLEITNSHLISQGNKLNNAIADSLINDLRLIEYDLKNFETYYKSLKTAYAKNEIENKILRDTLVETSKKGELNVEKLLSLRDAITENIELIEGKESLLITPDRMLENHKRILTLRNEGKYKFPIGDSYLDKHMMMGASPGQITTIFASTGMGKSAFAFQLIRKQINKNIPSMYISLENDTIMTTDRLISGDLRISSSLLYPKTEEGIPDYIFKMVDEELERMKNCKYFFFVEEPNLSLDEIDILVKEAKRKMGLDYLILTIDLLSMVKDFSGDLDANSIQSNMDRLHEMTRKLNIHIISVLQANRGAEAHIPRTIQDIDKLRPSMTHIKNSAAWGERSRLVLGLFRPKHYANIFFPNDPETEAMEDIMYVQIMKQNSGKLANLRYLYDPETYNFYKYEENK